MWKLPEEKGVGVLSMLGGMVYLVLESEWTRKDWGGVGGETEAWMMESVLGIGTGPGRQ